MSNYKIYNRETLSPDKNNILFFLHENALSLNSYTVTYQYIFNLMRIFSKDFNIIVVSKGYSTKFYEYYSNVNVDEYDDLTCHFYNHTYIAFDTCKEYSTGQKADEFSHTQRGDIIARDLLELQKNEPWLFNNLSGCISSQCLVSANGYDYEYVEDDKKDKVDKAVKKYINDITSDKLIGHTAFIQQPLGYTTSLMFFIMKHYPHVFHYNFLHDTAVAWLHGIPKHNPYTKNVKTYYFVDDNRGVREFHKFPLSELQEFYDIGLPNIDDIAKTKDFLFGGLFPFGIQHRMDSWKTYLKDLRCNGTIRTQTTGKPKVKSDSLVASSEIKISKKDLKNKDTIDAFVNEVITHPMVKSTIDYAEYNKELHQSLFTLILKCYYGKSDMVNFRFISSLANGTIPLIANNYDTGCLQIAPQFRKYLLVNNSNDILSKIESARIDNIEYEKVFKLLYDTYIDKKYFDKEYYNTTFKMEFFSEFYK